MQAEKVKNIWKQPENNSSKEIDRRKVLAAGGAALFLAGCRVSAESAPKDPDGANEKTVEPSTAQPEEQPTKDTEETKELEAKPLVREYDRFVEGPIPKKLVEEIAMQEGYTGAPYGLSAFQTEYIQPDSKGNYLWLTSSYILDPEDPEDRGYMVSIRYWQIPGYDLEVSDDGQSKYVNEEDMLDVIENYQEITDIHITTMPLYEGEEEIDLEIKKKKDSEHGVMVYMDDLPMEDLVEVTMAQLGRLSDNYDNRPYADY